MKIITPPYPIVILILSTVFGRCREGFTRGENKEMKGKDKYWMRMDICHKGGHGYYRT
jgi:hypothetical protein